MEELGYLKEHGKDVSLLYVEDEHTVSGETKALLDKFFPIVDTAYNGKEGLELYRQKRHDIVITDIKMPLMDGVEMIKEIQKIDMDQTVMVISAFDFSDKLHPFLQHDIDVFLPKPTQFDEMVRELAKLVKKVVQDTSGQTIEALNETVTELKKEIASLKNELRLLRE